MIIIYHPRFGARSEFATLDDAQRTIRECGPEFAGVALATHAGTVIDDRGETVGCVIPDAVQCEHAVRTDLTTADGLTVYDLDPQASELWAVAGPAGVDPRTIDPDALPDGFRWVDAAEWTTLANKDEYTSQEAAQ
jgi:hypothetical protein